MSHKALRLLIRDTSKSLLDTLEFGYGRGSDFDQVRNKATVVIWLDLLSASPNFANNNVQDYLKEWEVNLTFSELDKSDSIETEYSLILDRMDELVDRFINKLNGTLDEVGNANELTTQDVILSNFSQFPFVKTLADIRTGYTLSFTVQVPDKFDYCSLYE